MTKNPREPLQIIIEACLGAPVALHHERQHPLCAGQCQFMTQ
jgi:hypothetical protein